MTDTWPARQFSQGNPKGPAQADVPASLRRVADSIAELAGAYEVADVVFHQEQDGDGDDWPHMTVYLWERDGSEQPHDDGKAVAPGS